MSPRRLDAWLADAGFGTRTQVKRLLRSGRVTVDGEVIRKAGTPVGEGTVAVDGRAIEPPPTDLTVMLHKPAGHACTHDPAESPIIYDLLPSTWARLGVESAGRLDRETTGLMILSRDGQLLHRITHPRRKLVKRYRIAFEGTLPPDAVEQCARGLTLANDPRPTAPAGLLVEGPDRATLEVTEGRYRQVRRMMEALGVEVVTLHRDRIGQLSLPDDLPPGSYRDLTEEELTALLDAG